MKSIKNDEEINKLVFENKIVVVYFNGTTCGACDVIKGKVEKILKKFPEIKRCEVNGEINGNIAASYNIFSLPIILLFVEGKETIRVGRYVDLMELERNIERYYDMIFS